MGVREYPDEALAAELIERGLLDPWAVDDILKNEIIPQQQQIAQELRNIESALEQVGTDVPGGVVGPDPGGFIPIWERPFDFSANIGANNEKDVTQSMPVDGWIKDITVAWPAGTSNNLGWAFWGPDNRVIPDQQDSRSNFFAFEDTERTFTVWEPFEGDDEVEVKYNNKDGQGHFMECELRFVPYREDIASNLPENRIPENRRGV